MPYGGQSRLCETYIQSHAHLLALLLALHVLCRKWRRPKARIDRSADLAKPSRQEGYSCIAVLKDCLAVLFFIVMYHTFGSKTRMRGRMKAKTMEKNAEQVCPKNTESLSSLKEKIPGFQEESHPTRHPPRRHPNSRNLYCPPNPNRPPDDRKKGQGTKGIGEEEHSQDHRRLRQKELEYRLCRKIGRRRIAQKRRIKKAKDQHETYDKEAVVISLIVLFFWPCVICIRNMCLRIEVGMFLCISMYTMYVSKVYRSVAYSSDKSLELCRIVHKRGSKERFKQKGSTS